VGGGAGHGLAVELRGRGEGRAARAGRLGRRRQAAARVGRGAAHPRRRGRGGAGGACRTCRAPATALPPRPSRSRRRPPGEGARCSRARGRGPAAGRAGLWRVAGGAALPPGRGGGILWPAPGDSPDARGRRLRRRRPCRLQGRRANNYFLAAAWARRTGHGGAWAPVVGGNDSDSAPGRSESARPGPTGPARQCVGPRAPAWRCADLGPTWVPAGSAPDSESGAGRPAPALSPGGVAGPGRAGHGPALRDRPRSRRDWAEHVRSHQAGGGGPRGRRCGHDRAGPGGPAANGGPARADVIRNHDRVNWEGSQSKVHANPRRRRRGALATALALDSDDHAPSGHELRTVDPGHGPGPHRRRVRAGTPGSAASGPGGFSEARFCRDYQ
jgi:hypothetical protein